MRAVIRTGVDGLITDRPDLLQQVLQEERASRPDDPQLKGFVVSAHRGGRGLRPENTLPSFENGLDLLSTEL
jgi:glycerophosphoryl diester phosphodiesterase